MTPGFQACVGPHVTVDNSPNAAECGLTVTTHRVAEAPRSAEVRPAFAAPEAKISLKKPLFFKASRRLFIFFTPH
jgi:hypothetical protein